MWLKKDIKIKLQSLHSGSRSSGKKVTVIFSRRYKSSFWWVKYLYFDFTEVVCLSLISVFNYWYSWHWKCFSMWFMGLEFEHCCLCLWHLPVAMATGQGDFRMSLKATKGTNISHSYIQQVPTGVSCDSKLHFPICLRCHMTYIVLVCRNTQRTNKFIMFMAIIFHFRSDFFLRSA